MRILITSGGTKIPIDRVRDITNMSKGTFGSKIAAEFLKMGHDVVFMKAKGSKTPMSINIDLTKGYEVGRFSTWYNETAKFLENYQEYEYTTYDQYAEMLKFVIGVERPDIVLLAAAVSDYGVENYFEGKLRSNDMLQIKLKQLPKLISRVDEWLCDAGKDHAKIVGFKLLVNSKESDLIDAARRSLKDNGCAMVVANDLQDIKDNNHKVHLVFDDKVLHYKTDPNDPNFLARMVAQQSALLPDNMVYHVPPQSPMGVAGDINNVI